MSWLLSEPITPYSIIPLLQLTGQVSFADHLAFIYRQCFDLVLAHPNLLDSVFDDISNNRLVREWCIGEDQNALTALKENINQHDTLSQTTYIDICDHWRAYTETYAVLKRICGTVLTCPKDIYSLRAMILDELYQNTPDNALDVAATIECMCSTDHTDATGLKRTVLTCILHTRSEDLQAELIAYLENSLNIMPWHSAFLEGKTFPYHLVMHGQLKLLLQVYSQEQLMRFLTARTQQKRSLLHCLARVHATHLHIVLSPFSNGVKMALLMQQDPKGFTPLHYVAVADPEAFISILSDLPESSRLPCLLLRNQFGLSPVHLLIDKYPEALQRVYELLPEAARDMFEQEASIADRSALLITLSHGDPPEMKLARALYNQIDLVREAISRPKEFQSFFRQLPAHHRLSLFLCLNTNCGLAPEVQHEEAIEDGQSLVQDWRSLTPETLTENFKTIPDEDKYAALIFTHSNINDTWAHAIALDYPTLLVQLMNLLPKNVSKRQILLTVNNIGTTPLSDLAKSNPACLMAVLALICRTSTDYEKVFLRQDIAGNTLLHWVAKKNVSALVSLLSCLPAEKRIGALQHLNHRHSSVFRRALKTSPSGISELLSHLPPAGRIDLLAMDEAGLDVFTLPFSESFTAIPDIVSTLLEGEAVRFAALAVQMSHPSLDEQHYVNIMHAIFQTSAGKLKAVLDALPTDAVRLSALGQCNLQGETLVAVLDKRQDDMLDRVLSSMQPAAQKEARKMIQASPDKTSRSTDPPSTAAASPHAMFNQVQESAAVDSAGVKQQL